MNVVIESVKAGKLRETSVNLSTSAKVSDLKKEYAKLSKKSIHRLSFKIINDKIDIVVLDGVKTIA
jgi:hypothetical protein